MSSNEDKIESLEKKINDLEGKIDRIETANDENSKKELKYQIFSERLNASRESHLSTNMMMVTSNSVIIAMLGAALSSESEDIKYISIPLSMIGIILTFLWYPLLRKSEISINYYNAKSSEVEKELFPQTQSGGQLYISSWIDRIPTSDILRGFIALFLLTYIVILLQSLFIFNTIATTSS